ncbi:hypothetical protein [Gordonia paraffinivorans]|uniref:hypothetical protein n=1 Tax=Gordonia paraffinivorans TaxID=175628 RepID=UPI003FCCC52F
MTSALSTRASRRSVRKFLEPVAIAEAVAIEEAIVLPGYRAFGTNPAVFGLTNHDFHQVGEAWRRHRAIVERLRRMYSDAVAAELSVTPRREAAAAPGAVGRSGQAPFAGAWPQPVQAYRSMQTRQGAQASTESKVIAAVGFLLVAMHAVTDPTNCGTSSPSLNLVPPPLHRDRALLEDVLSRAVESFDAARRSVLLAAIGEAGESFEPYVPGPGSKLWVIRYNPHSLRTACRTIGLGDIEARSAS